MNGVVRSLDPVLSGEERGDAPTVHDAPPALRLHRIAKRYGSITAVDAVTLDVRQGEFFTLLGPSGSGKSTTLLLIAGFERLSSGEIYLGGRPVSQVAPHKRQIGVVFQSYALFPHLTVFENVAFALRNLRWTDGDIRAQVRAMLALVQLENCEERLPSELSGGQQQRVALARSLAFRPSVLLLDEPIGALDRKLREHMLIEFKRIHRTLGTTMIYVTHDQEEALVMSDRIGVMNHGKLIAVGTPRELYEDPNDPFVAEFLGETNLLAGTVQSSGRIALDGSADEVTVADAASPGDRVHVVVRPERIAVSEATAAPDGWNRLGGRIEEVIYVGEATKYRVRTAAGQLIRVKQLNRRLSPTYEAGCDVMLCWHVSDSRILAARHGDGTSPPEAGAAQLGRTT
jgi:putative spermidine/putrescine transport system ATP-binding protein